MRIKLFLSRVSMHVPLVGRVLRERDRLRRELDELRLLAERSDIVGTASEHDRSLYPFPPTHRPQIAFHGNLFRYLSTFANDEAYRILEIGSREVVSASVWKSWAPKCDYVGLDVLPGANVGVVGDAHRLSDYFEPESFDVVIAVAVFEHLAMPWVVAEEITKVLKPGGLVLIETHFSYSEHELPWHFFQFNKNGLECLFNTGLGYELVDSGMDTPMIGRFAFDAAAHLRGLPTRDLYCHSSLIARKVRSASLNAGADIWRASYDEVIEGTMYPSGTGLSSPEPAD
jgi:SAM-dependent methyltransferase